MKSNLLFLICSLFFNLGNVAILTKGNALETSLTYECNDIPNCWTNEIRYKIIEKYKKKYVLGLCVIADAMPGGIIHETGVGFTINQPISKQKARQILVECVQD